MKYTATVISLLSAMATFAAAAPTNSDPAVEARGKTLESCIYQSRQSLTLHTADAAAAGYNPNERGGEDLSGTIGDTVGGAFGIAGEWVELVANLITGGHGKGPGYGGGYDGNGGYNGGNGGYNGGNGGYNGGNPY